MQDKLFEIGESPIYNKDHDIIGQVYYKLSMVNKFNILQDHKPVYSGSSKLLFFMPKMNIFNHQSEQVGVITRNFSRFAKRYHYTQKDGATFEINGNILDRKFTVSRLDGTPVIRVITTSSYFALRPHTFALEFVKSDIDSWEGIAVIQGIRMMMKDERNNSNNTPAT